MRGAAEPGVGVVTGLERGGGPAERGHRVTAARVAEQRVERHPAGQADGKRPTAEAAHQAIVPGPVLGPSAEAGSGAIINLGSWIARLGIPVGALYSSTKGAMETLTRAWAAEFGPYGVRVNAISPGVVQTPAPGEVHPAEVMMKGTPAGRLGNPEAIAYAAVYLASDEAAFVHGSVLDVDGGRTTTAVIAG